ncbi:MAG: RidA family protein [Burkholderiales bacterium]|nr:RidA family protein [Burkholderiales bacterium]
MKPDASPAREPIADRLARLGLTLPPPIQAPGGIRLPFPFVHVVGRRVFVSGHGPQAPDGTLAPQRGKLGRELDLVQGREAARLTALAVLGSLQRALGSLDAIGHWCRVFGMVASAPGFNRQPEVVNGFSELILEVFGDEVGTHARSAVGMAELPFDIPVEVEAELELRAPSPGR